MIRHALLALIAAAVPAALALAQPDNNFCANAWPVAEGQFVFDMTGAVNTSQSTCDAPGTTPAEVWFDYSPTATGTATITTCGLLTYIPPLPVSISVFASCDGAQLACNSGACGGQSTVQFPANAGAHYSVRIAATDANFPTGLVAFRLSAACTTASGAPSNDCCANAIPIGIGNQSFTTINATRDLFSDLDVTADSNPDVWFDYTANATTSVKIRPGNNTPDDISFAVFDGSCSGQQLACDCGYLWSGQTRQTVLHVISGHHYLIRVRSISLDPTTATVSGHFSINTVSPPNNDQCSTARNITGLGTVDYDNTLADNSGPDNQLICDSLLGGMGIFQDVWFHWSGNIPAGQDVVISTINGPQIETKIAVYRDNCTTGVNAGALDCNDRVTPDFSQSRVVFTPSPGQAYLIRVGTRPNIENEPPPPGRPGQFTISTQPTCTVTQPPGSMLEPEPCGQHTNDACDPAVAVVIPCGTTTIFGTAPVINGLHDIDVYQVTLPVASGVSFGGNAEFSMRLGIFNDQCVQIAGRSLAFDPCGGASPLTSDLLPGTYYFAVVNTKADSPCGGKNHYAVTITIDRCEPIGRCCVHAACSVMTQSACLAAGGTLGDDGSACPPAGGNYVATACTDGLEDISATGAPGPVCDDCGQSVPLGFSFSFYGQTFSTVTVSSNGFLTFDPTMDPASFPPYFGLPDPGAHSIIAPWWANLDVTAGGNIYTKTLGTAPNRRFVAMWKTVQNAFLPGTGVTAEAILYEGTNRIAYRYGDTNLDVIPTIGVISGDGQVFATLDPASLDPCTTLALTPSTSPCCRADFNYSGALSVQDIFDFLNAWFAGDPRADFNGGGLAVQDIFDYLNAWFAGC